MSDPIFVKAILYNAQLKGEKRLGGVSGSTLTLSNAILSSIGTNRVSYLASTAPNWINKPKIEGVDWSGLMKMNAPGNQSEQPWQISPAYLSKLQVALMSTQQTLQEIQGKTPIPQLTTQQIHINQMIEKASTSDLISVIQHILTDEKAVQILTSGIAGSSTEADKMNSQCLEIMSKYPDILSYHKGDHAQVLGYGLVSHAMDAKHMIAAVYFLNKPATSPIEATGQQNFIIFLEKIKSGLGQPQADAIIRSRLQQMMNHIINNKEKIGLNDDVLFQHLAATIPPAKIKIPDPIITKSMTDELTTDKFIEKWRPLYQSKKSTSQATTSNVDTSNEVKPDNVNDSRGSSIKKQ